MATKMEIKESGKGYPLLGYVVYWAIAESIQSFTEFCAKLVHVGIDPATAMEPSLKSAVLRAVQESVHGHPDTFYRKVIDDKDTTVWVVVSQTVDATRADVTFQSETKVTYFKNSGNVDVTGAAATQIKELVEKHRDMYDADNIRAVVLRYITGTCQSNTMRDRGGVYFIPAYKSQEFQKLEQLFTLLPGCSLDSIPIIDTAQAKKSVWKSLVGEASEEMKTLKEEIANLPPDASERSVRIRLERYQALKEKVENYGDLLEGTADELKASLALISQALTEKLS